MRMEARPYLAALSLVLAGAAAASAAAGCGGRNQIISPQFARMDLVRERQNVFTIERSLVEKNLRERPVREQIKVQDSRPVAFQSETVKVAERFYHLKPQPDEYFPHAHMEGIYPRVPLATLNDTGYRTGKGNFQSGFGGARSEPRAPGFGGVPAGGSWLPVDFVGA